MIQIFTGFDQREAVGWHAFTQSVISTASAPVAFTPITDTVQRDGSNAFTYSRFLIPYLCGFSGFAIFVDAADMIAVADIAELWEMRSGWDAVQVVKHDYKTKHPRKYIGTTMEADNRDYPRKNWSSVVIWNCGHYMNRVLTPEFVGTHDGAFMHRFGWLPDDRIGELPVEWNWLCDEYGANTQAKILHWTAGIPGIRHYGSMPHAQSWFTHAEAAKEGPEETA